MLAEIYERIMGHDVQDIIEDIEKDELNSHLAEQAMKEAREDSSTAEVQNS